MTFSFDPQLDTDLDQVRFWTGDTESKTHYLEDATITALLASEGSLGAAVMAAFDYMLSMAARPNAQTVSTETGGVAIVGGDLRAAIEAARKRAAKRFGIPLISVSSVNVYRADSNQTSAPDYSNGTSSGSGRLVWEDD